MMNWEENYLDLLSERLGGKVLFATDDFFAEKENLIKPGRGVFIEDKYTDRGKWMDGWESRRKRTEGHDWAVLQLATPGIIEGFDIDTNHFLGNHPPFASVEAINHQGDLPTSQDDLDKLDWKEILSKSALDPGSQNKYACDSSDVVTHLRLHIFPDGGVARFRAYGTVHKVWGEKESQQKVDLASAVYGAKALCCNDMFFSSKDNLIMPGKGVNMGDGWETKRNRTPNNRDWIIVRLAHPGNVEDILVDTKHFKGNYPDSCCLDACYCEDDENILSENVQWDKVMEAQKLSADTEHCFSILQREEEQRKKYTHVRLNIYPDGGVSRLRVLGKIIPT